MCKRGISIIVFLQLLILIDFSVNGVEIFNDGKVSIDFQIIQQSGNNFTSNIVVKNNSDIEITDWRLNWTNNSTIYGYWNVSLDFSNNKVTAYPNENMLDIPSGEARAFGYYGNANNNSLIPDNITLEYNIDNNTTNNQENSENTTNNNSTNEQQQGAKIPVEYSIISQNNGNFSINVVIKNTSSLTISNWYVSWTKANDHIIEGYWNSALETENNLVTAYNLTDNSRILPGEAQAFGFYGKYTEQGYVPDDIIAYVSYEAKTTNSESSSTDESNDNETVPPDENTPIPTNINKDLPDFNTILGTQIIGPHYQFTDEHKLIEGAKLLEDLNSNIIKFALHQELYDSNASANYNFLDMAKNHNAFKTVFDMDFKYYLFWVDTAGSILDEDGFTKEDSNIEYKRIYDLTAYLLKQYDNSGKNFFIGHWEGDWRLVNDPYFNNWDVFREDVPEERINGMIDWLNIRQKAVDDAKKNIQHTNVDVFCYVELVLVDTAMTNGYPRIVNKVLPFTNIDMVSYSCYDVTAKINDQAAMDTELTKVLNYIENNLQEKNGLPFNKRIFIGEFGYPYGRFRNNDYQKDPTTPEEQLEFSRNLIKTAVEWGCPFVLYWQLYDNEYSDGKYNGFWMINDKNEKQPIYFFYEKYFNTLIEEYKNFTELNKKGPDTIEFKEMVLSSINSKSL